MPRELISVGTEANDGTGETLRAAGLKINANFAELYQALEGTETETELDARDTANRDRANHTGTQTADSISDFAPVAAAAAPVQSVAGRAGDVTLGKADVGLGQVDNTPDADKPISNATGFALTSLANSTQASLNEKLEAPAIANFETTTQLNARDAANRARGNHTGAQAISTVTGLQTALDAKLEAPAIASFETTTQLNARDTANRVRGNHTGAQAISTVTGLQTALDAKLEAPAIASFETTTQLNARDAANRARGNHTGTQPASTITGLTYGFTYDQQTEPVGPVAGATWRERSAGGLIVGQWEWSAIHAEWVSLIPYDLNSPVNSGSGAIAAGIADYTDKKRLVVSCTVQAVAASGTFDATNHLTITPLLRSYTNAAIATLSAAALVFNSSPRAVTTLIGQVHIFGRTMLSRGAVTGTPGSVSTAIHLSVRDVRQ